MAASLLLVFLGGSPPISTLRPPLDIALAVGTRLLRARLYLPPVLFVTWCCTSILWSVDRYATTRALAFLMPTFVALLLAASVLCPRGVMRALYLTTQAALVVTIADILMHQKYHLKYILAKISMAGRSRCRWLILT